MSDGFEQVIGHRINRYNFVKHFSSLRGLTLLEEILLAFLPLPLVTSNLS